ncbi:OsmC family protein [Kyrpidia tusciae]|uniref:OsmC family protein n=1 Tax=Kyrpidia tusciae TaxID=33943 RepID=UPI000F4F5175|nr:OsmC family protein [Kyrpidia tusciae]
MQPNSLGLVAVYNQVHVESPSDPERVRELLAHVERVCPVKDTLRGVPTRAVEIRWFCPTLGTIKP